MVNVRVTSDPLFDAASGEPPIDAIDVVVPAPLSLAVYMTELDCTGRRGELADLNAVYAHEATEVARQVQLKAGFVEAPGLPEPARLAVTHLVEDRVPGVEGLRPHVHVYVGATAAALSDEHRAPVDVDRLTRRAHPTLWLDHSDRLTEATGRFGLEWGRPRSRSTHEIVAPAWAGEQAIDVLLTGEPACTGRWHRRQIVAGEHRRRWVAQDLAAGHATDPPPQPTGPSLP